jgi:DNA-directed RNA polymerase III subunit RPC4
MFAPGSGIKREGGGGGGGFTVTSGSKSQNGSIPGVRFGTGSGSNPYVIADPQYPDEDEDVPRIDIEQINLISDDEDEQVASDTKGKGKAIAGSAKGGLKPVRLYRQEHKERKSQVTSGPSEDPSTENKSDSDTVLADEGATLPAPPTEEKRFKGVYQDDDDEVRIKDEPVEPAEMINRLHSPEPNLEASSSSAPDFKQTIDELGTDVVVKKNEPESPNQLRKKAPSKKKGNKFVIQTEEDRAEWERHLEDLAILTEELGGMLGPSTEKGKEKDAEGDIDMDAEKPVDRKEGRLYLFQFPPVMPKLYNPAKDPKPIVTGEKKAEGDVELTGSADKNAVDLTKDVKVEGEEIIIKKEDEEPTNKKGRERLADEEGFVGKLIVRESGRVELDWGGSRMLVGRGIETSFLTMGVLVDSKGCLDKDGKSTGEGTATGMGQIMGKLVVTPDWESMTEDLERQQKFERRQKREKHK